MESAGVKLIAAERQRHLAEEGFTAEHDDQWTMGELAKAAACYAMANVELFAERYWPATWNWKWWKPDDRKRNLVKAGALIAAEIDRITRIKED